MGKILKWLGKVLFSQRTPKAVRWIEGLDFGDSEEVPRFLALAHNHGALRRKSLENITAPHIEC